MTAYVTWTDSPSNASDQFFWSTDKTYNQSVATSGHTASLTGLPPFIQVNFEINAYHNKVGLYCYYSGQGYGQLTAYYPHPASLTLEIFNGTATITINGAAHGNGAVVPVYSPENIPISANANAGTFLYWYTTLGGLTSRFGYQTSISFFGAATAGTLVLVLNSTTNDWAGFSESAPSVKSVNATIRLPSSISWTNGNSTSGGPATCGPDGGAVPIGSEVWAAWVGMGGVSGSQDIWQAGVTIWLNQSGSPSIYMFIQDVNFSDPQASCPIYSGWPGTMSDGVVLRNVPVGASSWGEPSLGDVLTVYVQIGEKTDLTGTYAIGNVSIHDLSKFGSAYWPAILPNQTKYPLGAIPDKTTADWIVEDATPLVVGQGNSEQAPDSSITTFTNMTMNQPYNSATYLATGSPVESWVLYAHTYWDGGGSPGWGWSTNIYTPSLWGTTVSGRASFSVSFSSSSGFLWPA